MLEWRRLGLCTAKSHAVGPLSRIPPRPGDVTSVVTLASLPMERLGYPHPGAVKGTG
jgi:hypothetical protein